MLGVAGLVEERAPVVVAADRLDHEHHLARDLDRRAERARALAGARLEVEVDVPLRAEVDPEIAQRRLERRKHPVGRVGSCPARARGRDAATSEGRASERPIPSRSRKRRSPACSHMPLGLVEQRPCTARRARRARSRSACRARSSSATPSLATASRSIRAASRYTGFSCSSSSSSAGALEPLAPVAVGLVRHRRPQHPVRDLLAVDVASSSASTSASFSGVLAGQVAEIALAGEAPQLGRRALEPLRRVELRQLLVRARRSARARASPCGRRGGGSTPRRARR